MASLPLCDIDLMPCLYQDKATVLISHSTNSKSSDQSSIGPFFLPLSISLSIFFHTVLLFYQSEKKEAVHDNLPRLIYLFNISSKDVKKKA